MTESPLDPRCLPCYEWLDLPIWVYGPEQRRNVWANPAALRDWRAAALEGQLAAEPGADSTGAQARFEQARQLHLRGEVHRATWTLPRLGRPMPALLRSCDFQLAGGGRGALFCAERGAPGSAASSLLASMSHEIRTPMSGVLGLTELALQSSELSVRQRRFISLAHRSAQGLMLIITDLLDWARIESGQLALEHRPFLIAQCLAEALAPLAPTAVAKGLRLGWHIDAAVPPRLLGDAAKLRQVLARLAGNALKFTATGEVQLEVRALPGAALPPGRVELQISVRDTGIGMSDQQLTRVADTFVPHPAGGPRPAPGAGLGLMIVGRLVELMDGQVRVSSTEDRGSCFCITLGLDAATAVAEAVPVSASRTIR